MNAFALALQVLTALPSLIQTAEVAFSGKPGSGKFKKQFVMDTINAALVIAPTAGAKITTEQQEAIYGSSAALVDNIVVNVNAFKAIPDPATVVPSTK
jgi:hypothetical protein